MLHKDDLARVLEYNVWANRTMVRAAATLTVEEFKRDLGSSHGGVRGTLTHTMGAEWIWLERWKGVSPARGLDESEFPDVVALSKRWKAIDDHRDSWFRSLKEKAVTETIKYTNLAGKHFEAPLWQLVQHVVNHSTYHRGQIVTLFRLLGVKPVSTDLVLWDRKRKAREAREARKGQ